MRYHLFAHMDKNKVREGQKVEAFRTILGTMGNGNSNTSSNNMKAHLHHSISEGLVVSQLINYVGGWSKAKVERYYEDPSGTDYDRMFGKPMDEGHKGWDYLDWIGYGFHPGTDVNGKNVVGDQDFGWEFKSPINGKVVYEKRTWFANYGWGNLIVIEEDKEEQCVHCPIHCPK